MPSWSMPSKLPCWPGESASAPSKSRSRVHATIELQTASLRRFCYTFLLRYICMRNRMISLFGKPEPTLAERLRAIVSKTKAALSETVDTIFLGEKKVDPALLRQMENPLLAAHMSVDTTPEHADAGPV